MPDFVTKGVPEYPAIAFPALPIPAASRLSAGQQSPAAVASSDQVEFLASAAVCRTNAAGNENR